jgi:hypothetical protein
VHPFDHLPGSAGIDLAERVLGGIQGGICHHARFVDRRRRARRWVL